MNVTDVLALTAIIQTGNLFVLGFITTTMFKHITNGKIHNEKDS